MAALLMGATPALCQSQTTPTDGPFDHYRQSTVSLGMSGIEDGKRVFRTLGSGVVISGDGRTVCLLTAKHMFLDPTNDWSPTQILVRVPPPAEGVPVAGNGTILPLVVGGRNLWKSPEGGADLAVIRLPTDVLSHIKHVVGVADIGTSDDIYQGASILALGYPSLVSESYLFSPLARTGVIAWDKFGDVLGAPFLIDANLYTGNSGGPVFHVRSGLTRGGSTELVPGASLIGIVSQVDVEDALVFSGSQFITTKDQRTGQISQAKASVIGVGGIGIIEPVGRARGILDDCLAGR
ncbi:S1 family peptidase [Sphingomonas sp. UYP23]